MVGVHVGFIDTDLVRGIDAPKLAPADVAAAAFDGLLRGEVEVLVDDLTRGVKRGLSATEAPYLRTDR